MWLKNNVGQCYKCNIFLFACLIQHVEDKDNVIRTFGAPNETKLRVPHMGSEIGVFLAGICISQEKL